MARVAKHATMSVPAGTRDLQLVKACEQGVKQFVERYQKEGWRLVSKPKVNKVKMAEDGFMPKASTSGQAILWVPTSTGMRPDNPLYKPGKDQYEITAWFERADQAANIYIPDAKFNRLVAQGKIPAGLSVKE